MSSRDAGYTKTGNNFFHKLANWASFIPFAGVPFTIAFGTLGTVIESAGWLLRGKPLSAASAAVNGAASVSVNAGLSITGWGSFVNMGSAVVTGRTLGTHTRKVGEGVTSFVTKPLGLQPTVLRSYPAAIGSLPGATPSQPGRFATQVSNERGQNAQQQYNAYMGGEGGVHVNQLGSAYRSV
jgi:hypothetical protein